MDNDKTASTDAVSICDTYDIALQLTFQDYLNEDIGPKNQMGWKKTNKFSDIKKGIRYEMHERPMKDQRMMLQRYEIWFSDI